MGYTHYWYTDPELNQENFNNVIIDFKKLIPTLEHLGVKLANGHGEEEPEFTNDSICFNGLDKCGHTNRELGITWPSDKAQGVANLRHQHLEGNESFANVDGQWFAGLQLNTRTCDGSCSYETFSLDRVTKKQESDLSGGKKNFDCCKTAYRPYDLAVNICLVIAKHHLKDQIIVSSDGTLEQWKDAIEICEHFLGYGTEFNFQDYEQLKEQEPKPEPKMIDKTKPVEVGDIFEYSWGYDQTNVDFYKVIGLTESGKSARVIRIGQKLVKQMGDMCESVEPDPNKITGEKPQTLRIKQYRSDGSIYIGNYWRWNGTPCYQSHYA